MGGREGPGSRLNGTPGQSTHNEKKLYPKSTMGSNFERMAEASYAEPNYEAQD